MLGVIMYAGKAAMEPLPNIHPLALFIVATTLVYRRRALYPLYAYVLINGLLAGFAPWWLPYLYIWLPLWGAAMLLPRGMGPRAAAAACCAVCALHGLAFGALYAPSQALLYGLDWRATLAWIAAGLPWSCRSRACSRDRAAGRASPASRPPGRKCEKNVRKPAAILDISRAAACYHLCCRQRMSAAHEGGAT